MPLLEKVELGTFPVAEDEQPFSNLSKYCESRSLAMRWMGVWKVEQELDWMEEDDEDSEQDDL
jgi:hypothetical protein